MNSSKLITLLAVGAGLYMLYEWLSSQCQAGGSMAGNQVCGWITPAAVTTTSAPASTSSPAPTAPSVPVSIPVAATTPTTPSTPAGISALGLQILSLASVKPTQLYNWDQWLYYYNEVLASRGDPGIPLETVLGQNIPMATRQTNISLSTFLQGLQTAGLNGLQRFRGVSGMHAGFIPSVHLGGFA